MKFEVHRIGSRVADSTHDSLKKALTWIAKESGTSVRNLVNRRYGDGSHSVHMIDGNPIHRIGDASSTGWGIMENDWEIPEKIPTPMMDKLESDDYETISNFVTWLQDEKDVYVSSEIGRAHV